MEKKYSESVIKAAKVMTALKKKKKGDPTNQDRDTKRPKNQGTGSNLGKSIGSELSFKTGSNSGKEVGKDIVKSGTGNMSSKKVPQKDLRSAAQRRIQMKRSGQRLSKVNQKAK